MLVILLFKSCLIYYKNIICGNEKKISYLNKKILQKDLL